MHKKKLRVTFTKVKSYSNDLYNDMADDLANRGRNRPLIGINPKVIPNSLMMPIWNSIGPVDRGIRKYCKNIIEAITYRTYNKPLQHLLERHCIIDIDR